MFGATLRSFADLHITIPMWAPQPGTYNASAYDYQLLLSQTCSLEPAEYPFLQFEAHIHAELKRERPLLLFEQSCYYGAA